MDRLMRRPFRSLAAAALLAPAVGLAVAFAALPASAQDFGPFAPDGADPTLLRLDGDIVPGTAEQFTAALETFPETRGLVLRGRGDTFEDALAIATIVHERGYSTWVEPNSFCYVACGLIYLAGIERRTDGIVGVSILLPTTNEIAAAQIGLADLIELVLSFDLSPEITSALLQTPPGGLYAFSPHEIARFGLNAPSVGGPEGYDAVPYAVLYEHAPDGPPEAAWPSFPANVTWRTDDTGPLPALVMTAEVPERSLTLTATFAATPRDNAEPLFTVDVAATTGELFAGVDVSNVVLLARNFEGTGGIGGFFDAEKATDGAAFHFALEDHPLTWPTLMVHLERRWLSFVMNYENGEAAELLIEVGDAARALIEPVLDAWDAVDAAAPLTAFPTGDAPPAKPAA